MYAIIDIETTGGNPKCEKITEIAIYLHDGSGIVDEFVSLVNPEKNIPAFITNLTGITNEMVEDAPRFYEIAKKIVELTEGSTFVAHNARFDYSFIRQEFKSLGYSFKRDILDTVTLSRKLLPGHGSYSLGNLCQDLRISIVGRHRASGDALATVRLLEILIKKDMENDEGRSILFRNAKISKLNPKLDSDKIRDIPEEPGVYYFYNEKGDLIYIGKSNNLRQRINTHLSNNTTNRSMEMRDQIADIDWEETGSELIALLKESAEIKKNKPIFNRAQRRTDFQWGIFGFTDQNGYMNFRYGPLDKEDSPLYVFTSKEKAKAKLNSMVEVYGLCQKLSGLYDTDGACFQHQVGVCKGACCGKESPEKYNERAAKANEDFMFVRRNFFIIDSGRDDEERCAVKIINGEYAGYGYFNINDMGFGLSAVHECIKPSSDNRDIQVILKQYLKNKRVEKILEF
ncbi:MAG TPA: exonuclease domain-containing protein [Bacteroidales bacterium]|nr:exonuclease domain-containing protein [Bacteroidales bacterium]HPT21217.1 exonuclease domain-containing protein [Bacteroidales bacterium]